MFGLPVLAWIGIAGLVTIFGLGTGLKIEAGRLDTCKTDAASFKATTKANGELAAAEAKRIDLSRQKTMEVANAKITTLTTTNAAIIKRLRNNNPPSSDLPKPPADTKRPDLLCLDRAEYQREDGILIAKLFAGARSLADEGTTNTLRLSTAAEWAKSLGATP